MIWWSKWLLNFGVPLWGRLFLLEILLAHATHTVHSRHFCSRILTKTCSSRWDALGLAHSYHAALRVLLLLLLHLLLLRWHLHLLLICASIILERRYNELLWSLRWKFKVRVCPFLKEEMHGNEEHRLRELWLVFWVWELPDPSTDLLVHLGHQHDILHLLGWESPRLIRIKLDEHLHVVSFVLWL